MKVYKRVGDILHHFKKLMHFVQLGMQMLPDMLFP